ncbi:MAG: hypothetical protein ABSA83_13170 [Verrucomicrobiota bacterium]|jgi:hypothetical protein
MNSQQARALVAETFPKTFDKVRFHQFVRELLNGFNEEKAQPMAVPDAFAKHVRSCIRLGTYESPEREQVDVLVVNTTEPWKLQRTRSALRDFVAHKLKRGDNEKDAALVAFVSPTERQWRFSYVKMEYAAVETESGKVGVETRLTPARRYSYIVGEGESCHTAQSRFLALLQDTENHPKLAQLEEAFSVEAVTKEFFKQYAALFGDIEAALQKLAGKNPVIAKEFKARNVSTVDFAKKLMGQIVFLYFLQKKGWLGVARGQDWGTGPHDFLRRLTDQSVPSHQSDPPNIFNDVLEPLFYNTLATDRGHEAWCNHFKCRIPFLNGGLFEPIGDYDWRKTDIILPNKLFTNSERSEAGDIGTGVLDVFDRYNFTVNEAEPLEKEVAIDPEMLGKVFENLIEEIHSWLEAFRPALKKRDDQGKYFWELRSCAYWQEFERPKILYQEINRTDCFSFDDSGYFANNKLFMLPDAPRVWLGLFNSRMGSWYLHSFTGVPLGGFLALQWPVMKTFPIPAAPTEKQKAVERLVDRILAAKQRDAGADTSALEREIDGLVYALYGLNPDEIKIVEGA